MDNNFIYGLAKFKFLTKELGYISEEGLAWGGDKPEKVKINAAQVKSGPVKVITKNKGSHVITFKLIQLNGASCEQVLGGKYESGVYTPPVDAIDLVGAAEITTDSGHVISIPKGSLTAKPSGNINGGEVLSIECELELLSEGTAAPFTIKDPVEPAP